MGGWVGLQADPGKWRLVALPAVSGACLFVMTGWALLAVGRFGFCWPFLSTLPVPLRFVCAWSLGHGGRFADRVALCPAPPVFWPFAAGFDRSRLAPAERSVLNV